MPGSAPLGPDGEPAASPAVGHRPDSPSGAEDAAEPSGAHADVPGPRVPLVVPPELPLARDGRRARAADAAAPVSPLRALAGAALAVAGVVLGIGALLSVTDAPDGSPALSTPDAQVADGSAEAFAEPASPDDDAPAVDAPAAAAAAPASAAPASAPRRSPARVVAASPQPAAAAPAPRRIPAARPPVTVLNNSTRTGLADRAAARFVRNGWPVRQVGNFRGQLRATTVYYEPGQRAAAQRFAGTFRGIQRVLPRAANIPGPRGLVVVLTRSFDA